MYICDKSVSTPLVYSNDCLRSYDLLAASDYGINACGFIRSDFAELNERNDAVGMARLLSRFQELQEDPSMKDLTDEQRFSLIRPRGMQTPAELDRFEQYCLDEGLKFMRKLHESDLAKLSSGTGESEPVSEFKPE